MATDVDEGYFNDLSRQPHTSNGNSASPNDSNCAMETFDQSELPKTKRIACVVCRKRKLKCDGNRPKCATCARLGHNCAYDEVRKKSGPKRGYVKELEARLAQVETQLQGKATNTPRPEVPQRQQSLTDENVTGDSMAEMHQPTPQINGSHIPDVNYSGIGSGHSPFSAPVSNMVPEAMATSDFAPDMSFGLDDNFSWEMVGLGLEEPMPMQEAIDELTHIYFEKVHPFEPMLHKGRYYSLLSLAPHARPQICLRYAMWALAASVTEKYMPHADIFYRRSRKYAERDEMKGVGEGIVSVQYAQTWTMLCTYEFKNMYFPRAWMSVGRAARMVNMLSLNRVDGIGMDVKQGLPPPRDWIDREERRRTFWMTYCVDRYASIGTGWPMTIDERDIMTNLPASEEAYELGIPQKTHQLREAIPRDQVASLSAFAGVVYTTHFFGMNHTHLHRAEHDDEEENLQGKFWKRHSHFDNILSNFCLALPSHLRLPHGVKNSNIVFLNFSIYTSIICLHQAAIFKSELNKLPNSVIDRCRSRCLLAASEIADIMRMTSHLDIGVMNPFMAFSLYVAARVFVQYLKNTPSDTEVKSSLEFLLTAMSALRRKNPLSESFMIQLNLDIEGCGLDILLHNPDFSSIVKDKRPQHLMNHHGPLDQVRQQRCPTIFPESSESQNVYSTPPRVEGSGSDSSPSIRSDSPRQTPYALSNIQLHAMRAQSIPNFVSTPQPSNLSGLDSMLSNKTTTTSNTDWHPANTANLHNNENHPVGMKPFINTTNLPTTTTTTTPAFDTEMSDHTTAPSRHNSTGLTPQSSHSAYPSSSNTSYSPLQVQDEDPLTSAAAVTQAQAQSKSIETTLDEAFKVPVGWDIGGAGGTGMTPGGEWENVMRNMNWESMGTGMTPKFD